MRNPVLLVLVLALVTGLTAQAPAAARKPLASAKVLRCSTGLTADARLALFRAAARRVRGTERMWIRLKLQERRGRRYRTVAAPDMGVWRKSRPGVARFVIRQRVLGLAEGATYRVVVHFRWYAEDGTVLKRARRLSPGCRQAGALPNLRVSRIGGRQVSGGFRYAVDVVNRGKAAAGPSTVRLSVDGDVVDTPAVAGLAPGETRRIFVNGPACAASVSATADPDDLVREVSEVDNTRSSGCPG